MIRILLYTPDPKLPLLLNSALKPECRVLVESQKQRLKEVISKNEADIVVLDFGTNYSSLPEQFEFYEEIIDCRLPIVVMIDGLNQSTAMEFMQCGAFDCIRKPPSLVELKVVVRRAHEHALMKAELERMRQTVHSTQGCDRLSPSEVPKPGAAHRLAEDRTRNVPDCSNLYVARVARHLMSEDRPSSSGGALLP